MRFVHLSDLHIGKRVNEFSMLEDQEFILTKILNIIDEQKPDGVIIAGDVYDKSVPSAEAVELFDDFLVRLSKRNLKVFVISGNHDSAERVAYLSAVVKAAGVYFSPVYDGECEKVTFTDAYGEVDIWLLPYVRPVNVRAVCEGFEGNRFCEAVEYITERIPMDPEKRNVLVTHHFVVGGEVTEEDELGGAGLVPARIFDGFDYTALGHLHGAHPVGRTCRYSGSPLKHSFNEIGDEKTVALVELREKGEVLVECVPLHPLRDLREVRGTYDEVVHTGLHDPAKEDYIRVVLTDEEDILDAAVKLRVVYPNLMRLAYDNRRTREYREIGGSAADVPEDGAIRPEDVFAELFELQNNVPPDEELLDVVRGIFETCEEVECE
jgi:exonuclease SbcD